MGEEKKSYWPSITSSVVFGLIGFVVVCISIPGGRWIRGGNATRALSEIYNIKLSITYMLSDAGSTNLRDFFDDAAFGEAVARLGRERDMAPFAASVEIYSHCTYVLLRGGRNALEPGRHNDYPSVLKPAMLKRLANTYFPELALDPWGEFYRIFPGPWPENMGPVVFRTYLPPHGELPEPNNLLMSGLDWATGEPITFGVPGPPNQDVYIWSFGANLISGQPIYDPSHAYAPAAQQHYDASQEPELCGGGDDINNWDRNQTFMRFYN